jgi:hypothetical protein
MAETKKPFPKKIKEILLLIFLGLSTVLVLGIWTDGLLDKEPTSPSYVRPTPIIFVPEVTVIPREEERKYQGQGGQGQHATPSPTYDPDSYATEDISDDLRDE